MIAIDDLFAIAQARLHDAEVLAASNCFDSAMYLCGYAVELGLKARICKTLQWEGFPSSNKEFEGLQSFKTHNLRILLHLSGIEGYIRSQFLREWSIVMIWNPEMRYNAIGTTSALKAQLMMTSTKSILEHL